MLRLGRKRWWGLLLIAALLAGTVGLPAAAQEVDATHPPETAVEPVHDEAEDPPEQEPEPAPEPAEEPVVSRNSTDDERSASNARELYDLLEQDVGGVIRITGDIEVNGTVWGRVVTVTQPVRVELGDYTIRVLVDTIFYGPIHFVGSGTAFYLDGSFTVYTDHQVIIEAVGDEAVGVHIAGDHNMTSVFTPGFAQVLVQGENAVGIDVQGDLEARCAHVEARGPGSMGIRATGAVDLLLCMVEAEGHSVVSDAGRLLLDTSYVEPPAAGAEEETRIPVTSASLIDHQHWTMTGVAVDEEDLGFIRYDYKAELDNDDDESYRTVRIPAVWDTSGVDIDRAGDYPIYGHVVSELAARYPMFNWPDAEGSVHVLHENSIYIVGTDTVVDQERLNLGNFRNMPLRVEFTMLLPLRADDVVSVYVLKEGESDWARIKHEYVDFDDELLYAGSFFMSELEIPYRYRIEVFRDGQTLQSNELEYALSDNKGGDRDNTDRQPDTDSGQSGGTDSGGRRSRYSDTYRAVDDPPAPNPEEAAGNTGETADTATQTTATTISPAAPMAQPPAAAALRGGSGVTYTARELALMVEANPAMVPFLSGDMTLLVPSSALSGIRLAEDELFQVELAVIDDRSFSVRLFAGARELVELGGEPFVLRLPGSLSEGLDPGELACLHESGSTAQVEQGGGVLMVSTSRAGVYTLSQGGPSSEAVDAAPPHPNDVQRETATPPPETYPTAGFPLMVVALGVAGLVLGAYGWYWLHTRLRKA